MEEIQSTNVNDGVNISTDVETLASDLSKHIPMDTLDNIMDAVLKRHIADQNENWLSPTYNEDRKEQLAKLFTAYVSI